MARTAKRDIRRLTQAERRKKMVEMRIAGASWRKISDTLRYGGHANAIDDWNRMLAESGPSEESKEQARQLALMRLDRLLEAVWQKGVGGSLPHWDRAQKNVERSIVLWGLDAPKTTSNTDVVIDATTMTDEQLEQFARYGTLPSSVPSGGGTGEASPAARPDEDPSGEGKA